MSRVRIKSLNKSDSIPLQGREITLRNFSDLPVVVENEFTLPPRREVSTGIFWPYELTLNDIGTNIDLVWKFKFNEAASVKRIEIIERA